MPHALDRARQSLRGQARQRLDCHLSRVPRGCRCRRICFFLSFFLGAIIRCRPPPRAPRAASSMDEGRESFPPGPFSMFSRIFLPLESCVRVPVWTVDWGLWTGLWIVDSIDSLIVRGKNANWQFEMTDCHRLLRLREDSTVKSLSRSDNSLANSPHATETTS